MTQVRMTLRIGLRHQPVAWLVVSILLLGMTISLTLVAHAPATQRSHDLDEAAICFVAWMFACGGLCGTLWARLDGAGVIRLVPGARQTVRRAFQLFNLTAALAALLLLATLRGLGCDLIALAIWGGSLALAFSGGLIAMAYHRRYPAAIGGLLTLLIVASVVAATSGVSIRLNGWAALPALVSWPLAVLWLTRPRNERESYTQDQTARLPWATKLSDAWQRALHRPASRRRQFVGNPAWLLRVPVQGPSMRWLVISQSMFGLMLFRPLSLGTPDSFTGIGIDIWVRVFVAAMLALPSIQYVDGIERLMLLPNGFDRPGLQRALRGLYFAERLPTLVGASLVGIACDTTFYGPHPWRQFLMVCVLLTAARLSSLLLVAHPLLVRKQFLGAIAVFVSSFVLAILAGDLAVRFAAWLDPLETVVLVLLAGNAMIWCLARFGRRGWMRANIADIAAEWRLRRELSARGQPLS